MSKIIFPHIRINFISIFLGCCLLLCSSVQAESPYGKIGSLHDDPTQKINQALKKKEYYVDAINEVVSFMQQMGLLRENQRRESEQFTQYVQLHIKSVASCKNFEDQFNNEKRAGSLSKSKAALMELELKECKTDLQDDLISFKDAKTFFETALAKLEELQETNDVAGMRFRNLKPKLEEVNALLKYLDSTRY